MAKIEERHRKAAEDRIASIPDTGEPWGRLDAVEQYAQGIADGGEKLRVRVSGLETALGQALTAWHEGDDPYGPPTPDWVKAAEQLLEGT